VVTGGYEDDLAKAPKIAREAGDSMKEILLCDPLRHGENTGQPQSYS
jgi:hypothetical protein